ncbi:MAG: molybdopterin-dependent oxidoreductase [Nitrososphaerales archaeon]
MKRVRLPPGQYTVDKLPVLHAGGVPAISNETWSLEVYGEVENSVRYSYGDLLKLPKTEIVTDIHCITKWSKLGARWGGVRSTDIFKVVKPTSRAHFAVFESEGDWSTSLPVKDLEDEDALIACEYEGRDLEIIHGGPVRTVVPKKYFYKSAKWLRGIKLTEHDELGFWERRGYSNTADPWTGDRFT